MIYFTSDLHFGHQNVIRFDNRPFPSAAVMDEELVKRWNAKVQKDDTVYILGDVSWHPSRRICEIFQQLNGHKILITGNHDNRWLNKHSAEYFDEVTPYKEITLPGNRHITLCHYPIHFFNRHHYGAYMLYGHVHNSHEWNVVESWKRELQRLDIACNMYNVGCMIWNYEPVSLDEIIADPRFQPDKPEGVND